VSDAADEKALTQQQVAHSLRHFIMMGVLWAVYGPNATVAGPVLSGFALHIGLTEAQVGFLASVVGLIGASQLFSSHFTRGLRNKRRFCVMLGVLEISAATAVVLTGALPEGLRFPALATLLLLAYLLGHTVNPIFNSWLSNILPEEIRASYIGRRMMYLTVAAIVYLYLASRWLDLVPGTSGFLTVFLCGWLGGVLGYVMLALTPFPKMQIEPARGLATEIARPLREPSYRSLAAFVCTWQAAGSMAGSFYAVYMIKRLDLSYARVAIYTNLTMLFMMIGYRLWSVFVQRYGSKPVIQVLIVPSMLNPALWALTTPATYAVLIPITRILAGICWSGISVATSNLLYKIVPSGRENSEYFANWTSFMAIGAAVGPFTGGVLREYLTDTHLVVASVPVAPLQVVFAAAAVAFLVPVLLSRSLVEPEAASPQYLLGQFRGNLLSFAYNYALFRAARREERRAEAARALGRSHSPLAVHELVDALADVSPEVRSEAARGLGEARLEEGVAALVDELRDDESDIRPQAAEALGKIGGPVSLSPLLAALEDGDPRVRMSAALALGEVGGDEAREALVRALHGPFRRGTFAALADGASRTGDLRVIGPALEHLPEFRFPVLRMQIINAICRVLGEPKHFYALLMADAVTRAAMRERMTARILRLLRRAKSLDEDTRGKLVEQAKGFRAAMGGDDFVDAAQHARKLAAALMAADAVPGVPLAAARSILGYLETADQGLLADEGVIFLVVCLTSLARFL
jgi:MFS family permease